MKSLLIKIIKIKIILKTIIIKMKMKKAESNYSNEINIEEENND